MIAEAELRHKRYILQSRDGDYVDEVTTGELETVKLHFHFTKDRQRAKVFSFEDLFSKKAVTSVGGEFIHGYVGNLICLND